MQYVVLDLEWNQPRTPKEALPCAGKHKLEGEIIQIGIVRLDGARAIVAEERMLFRPRFYTKMSRRISELTGITNEMIDGGAPLEDGLARLKAIAGEGSCAFFTWGMDDLRVLRQNLAMLDMDGDWLPPWYNLQLIYGLQSGAGRAQKALTSAMESLELPVDRPAHDALNDAHFAALILQKLDMEKGLAEYPADGRRKRGASPRRRRARGGKQKGAMSVPVKNAKS